jgi:hypothetical protein
MNTVNERSTAYLTISFFDPNGTVATPASVEYRIDDYDTGIQIRDDASISAGTSVQITLTPGDNTLLNNYAEFERRRVTVIAHYGQDDQQTAEYVYSIANLRHVALPAS